MTSCWACETELRPEWKFCIQCGVPVGEDASHGAAATAKRTVGPLAIFGIIFAGIGLLVLTAALIVFFVRQ